MLEKSNACFHLPGEREFFGRTEPRPAHIRWMKHLEDLFRTLRIYHFKL